MVILFFLVKESNLTVRSKETSTDISIKAIWRTTIQLPELPQINTSLFCKLSYKYLFLCLFLCLIKCRFLSLQNWLINQISLYQLPASKKLKLPNKRQNCIDSKIREKVLLTSLCLPHVSSASCLAYSGSSVIKTLSNKVPDFTWKITHRDYQNSSCIEA